MNFEIGETVMYPRHGAAVIEKIYQRKFRGDETTFLTLKCKDGLTIDVPAANAEMVGVRDVVDTEGLDRIFDVLRNQQTEEPTNWSRRFKANEEKIASGDMIKVAEVVRDLSRRENDKGLSTGEKRTLTAARKLLIGELALANNSGADAAGELLNSVLAS